jgi:hypothetical protein
MQKHPAVIATHFNKEVHIDEELFSLIQSLWNCGINTQFSCQGDEGERAMISFPSDQDYLKFINSTVAFEPITSFVMMKRNYMDNSWNLTCSERSHIVNGQTMYYSIGLHMMFQREDIAWLTKIWEFIVNNKKNPFPRIEVNRSLDWATKMIVIRKSLNERYCNGI